MLPARRQTSNYSKTSTKICTFSLCDFAYLDFALLASVIVLILMKLGIGDCVALLYIYEIGHFSVYRF